MKRTRPICCAAMQPTRKKKVSEDADYADCAVVCCDLPRFAAKFR
jgi:hypothetical protein